MEQKKFTIGAAFRYGWEKTKVHLNFFLIFLFVILAVMILLRMFSSGNEFTNTVSSILSFIFDLMISIGVIKTVIRILNDDTPTLDDFFLRDFNQVISYILGTLLYLICCVVGLVLLIVPGIILFVRLKFYSYLILEKGLGPVAALKESFKITQGYTIDLIIFGIIVILLNFLGMIPFGMGLVVTIPTTTIAVGYIYRKLSQEEALAVPSSTQQQA